MAICLVIKIDLRLWQSVHFACGGCSGSGGGNGVPKCHHAFVPSHDPTRCS
jgi:hypothetical protein